MANITIIILFVKRYFNYFNKFNKKNTATRWRNGKISKNSILSSSFW